jgi:superfamily II RNA helicase
MTPLLSLLAAPVAQSPEGFLEAFAAHQKDAGLELYPAQEDALLALVLGSHVILATPTGSGKSLVALGLHARSLQLGQRTFYTAPIKALVSEKFFALSRELGPENVGLMTGDASVNRDAKVICCTAEILARLALREGDRAGVASVVMDELHFYGDRDRGMAWQLPLLTLKNTQFLLMSATLGDTRWLREDLKAKTGREVEEVRGMERPVPLEWEYRETPLYETLSELIASDRAPVYVVHFAQRAAHDLAQDLTSVELASKQRKQEIKDAIGRFPFDSPYGKDLGRFVKHGVGVHHAGMLPRYRLLVEKLAQKGLLTVISGTDTLGVGVNVPIRTVLFTQLFKYDGQKTHVLGVREFLQIAGRAGRRGFDVKGWVLAQAPEHAIENRVLRMKAEGDPKKMKKLVLRKPPEENYAHYEKSTFERLSSGAPEKLESRFRVTAGMVMDVLDGRSEGGSSAEGDACRVLGRIIRSSHESRRRKFEHGRRAITLVRALKDAGILKAGQGLEVDPELQHDFSLTHALSLFATKVIERMDPFSPAHALDVLSVCEAIVEDPAAVLMRQLDVRKKAKLDELKAAGVEYEERMKELEKIDVERPLVDFLETELTAFKAKWPWLDENELRPKSVARELFERGLTFQDYVRELGLERSEGVLLRYLSDAYKALRQTVPEKHKTDELLDLESWLGTLVRGVDASLLDEWERLKTGEATAKLEAAPESLEATVHDVTKDVRGFRILVRNAVFRLVQLLARRRFDDAAALVQKDGDPKGWTGRALEELLSPYFDEHASIDVGPASRAPDLFVVAPDVTHWKITQVLLDPEDSRQYALDLRVLLEPSRDAGAPVIDLVGLAS